MFSIIRTPKQKPIQVIRTATRAELDEYEKYKLVKAEELHNNAAANELADKN